MSTPEPDGVTLWRAFTAPRMRMAVTVTVDAWQEDDRVSLDMYRQYIDMVDDVHSHRKEKAVTDEEACNTLVGVMLHTAMELGEQRGSAMIIACRLRGRITHEQFVWYMRLARDVWTHAGKNHDPD